jgi:hypothetical protein
MEMVMKAAVKRASAKLEDAEEQLQSFIDKFEPSNQALIRSVRKALRKRFSGANELVYDNYNFFVIGFSPTERPTDAIASMACSANGVGLAFPYIGTKLPDPHKVLRGSGTSNRSVHLESAATLARPEVADLIDAAIAICKPLPGGRGRVIIRAVSAKQRPRRK